MGKLVRDRMHMRPMLAVLKRYGIGQPDKYRRGVWIEKSDLPAILEGMKADPTCMKGGAAADDYIVQGTNLHNHVRFVEDFKQWLIEP